MYSTLVPTSPPARLLEANVEFINGPFDVCVRAASSVSDNDGPDASVRRVGEGGRGALPFGIDHATSRRRRANTTTTPTAKKIRLIFAKDSLLDEGPVVGSDWTVVVRDELAGTVVVGAT